MNGTTTCQAPMSTDSVVTPLTSYLARLRAAVRKVYLYPCF